MSRKKKSGIAILLGAAAILIGFSQLGDEETFHLGRTLMFLGFVALAFGLGFYPSRRRPTQRRI